MKISYLITCSTETDSLRRLLIVLSKSLFGTQDEIIVVVDSDSKNDSTEAVLDSFRESPGIKIVYHGLNKNYGAHKNWGAEQCNGDWIFQIDGDEYPSEYLIGENIHAIVESNSHVELIFVPRINDYIGVLPEHAAAWGWRLTPSKFCESRPVVNWPDYQGRIYKRIPERIRWDRRLHEKIQGHESYSMLPIDEVYALYHNKTIEKQLNTNKRYNSWFTHEENQGHKVI